MVIISDPVSFLAAHSVSYLAAHHCNPRAQLSARLVNCFFLIGFLTCFLLAAHRGPVSFWLLTTFCSVGQCILRLATPIRSNAAKGGANQLQLEQLCPPSTFLLSLFLSFQPAAQLINDQVEKLRVIPPILSENFSPLKYVNIWERLSFENSTNDCRTFLAPFFIGPRYT